MDWYSVNIHKEDIESVCFSWTKNENSDYDGSQISSFLSQVLPTTTKNTTSDLNFVGFVHISLKEDFNRICNIPGVGVGKKSLFISFNNPRTADAALDLLGIERHLVIFP